MWTSTRSTAAALDDADELGDLRARYDVPPGVIRLDGDSGGAQPKTTPAQVRQFIEHSWTRGNARSQLGKDWRRQAQLAEGELSGLIGASPREITVAESTSMNLFKTLVAAARLRPERSVLAIGHDCFASDHYLARSAADFTGFELSLLRCEQDASDAVRSDAAVIALSHTDVRSGEVRDVAAWNERIHDHGALSLWDLSHSAGALRVDLHGWDADFAIGCGYRYLGGGSGAPGYTYIAEHHQARLRSEQQPDGDPKPGCGVLDPLERGFGGTPSEFSMAALRAGLSIVNGASPRALEAKATRLVSVFLRRLSASLPERIEVVARPDDGPRSQLCLRHRHAQYVAHGLFSRGVVVDFLEPDLLRLSFAPAWLRYVDAWEAAELLHEVLDELDTRGECLS